MEVWNNVFHVGRKQIIYLINPTNGELIFFIEKIKRTIQYMQNS
jgi:hypothetical protein